MTARDAREIQARNNCSPSTKDARVPVDVQTCNNSKGPAGSRVGLHCVTALNCTWSSNQGLGSTEHAWQEPVVFKWKRQVSRANVMASTLNVTT